MTEPVVTISNDLLHEIIDAKLDERDRKLQEFVFHQLMKFAHQSQQPVQPRAIGQEALFWKEIKTIFEEQAPDSPNRLWTFIAMWAKDKGVPGGEEIYQYGGNLMRKGY